MVTRGRLGLLAVLAALCASPTSGQVTTADLSGVVRDATGAVRPDAVVTAVNPATNAGREAATDGTGRFALLALEPGVYEVTARAPGFRDQTLKPPLTLSLGSVTALDFVLTPAVSDTVVVVAPAPLLDPTRTSVSSVVSRQQIESLPINRRDFISFALVTPGISPDRTPQQGSSATSGLTFAGQRGRSNSILVDGLDNNDSTVGGVRAAFSQDAVAEFQVLTGSYSAELGKASGGIVNIITRSGSNVSSGTAFVLFRDETLNAKEHFERFDPSGRRIAREKAPYSQKQFGGTMGGPLRRDRTFYFASFERLDIYANNFVNIDDRTPVSLFGQQIGTPADILRRAGFAVETGHVPYSVTSSQLFTKIDQRLRPGQTLEARVNWATGHDENSEPWGGQIARSRGGMLTSDDLMGAASHKAVLSPALINEFRAQVAFRDQTVLALDPTCAGPCDREDEGGPTLEVAGVASVGRHRFSPQPRDTLRYQALDTLTLQHRAGIVKLGFDYNAIDHRSGAIPLHVGGRYIFAPLPAIPGLLPEPISSIQALALGLPAAYVQGYGKSGSSYLVQDFSAFAQEDWNVVQDVTVKLGVRYQSQFWPSVRYDVPMLEPYTWPSTRSLVPRLGAAWSPAGRTFSAHAAYGRFYDNHLTSIPGVTDVVDGSADGIRTLVLRFPRTVPAWNAPGRRLPEAAVGSFPSLAITIDPNLETPYADHATFGLRQQLPALFSLSVDFIRARGRNQVGTLDYNPLVPELGPDRRPGDDVRNGIAVPGTSASILQYTSFGDTWYRGLAISLARRFDGRSHLLASYTLSKAEDSSTDYQNAFIPQDTGKGRDPHDPRGLPIGFNPALDRGPSLQDQRHRLVLSGSSLLPGAVQVSSIVTVASGRPYNILAGVDLNGDGNGGAFPPDRARVIPGDPTSSVTRNSGTLPAYATTDVRISRTFRRGRWAGEVLFEAFNLFNRANFTEINNVFGTGAYPVNPLPAFGQFDKAAPPFQGQIGLRLRL
jgi:hypothetical protein